MKRDVKIPSDAIPDMTYPDWVSGDYHFIEDWPEGVEQRKGENHIIYHVMVDVSISIKQLKKQLEEKLPNLASGTQLTISPGKDGPFDVLQDGDLLHNYPQLADDPQTNGPTAVLAVEHSADAGFLVQVPLPQIRGGAT